MRKTTILLAGTTLILASAASAQQQPAPPPASTAPKTQSGVPEIRTVTVVDITELPADTQTRVKELVSKRSDEDLQKLRSSIDATPKVKSALEAKGLSSAQVIAATLGTDGALMLITRKAS